MVSDRYVKWTSDCGLAYAHIASEHVDPYVLGANSVGIVKVAVSDESLVDVGKEEFDAYMNEWCLAYAALSVKLAKEYDLVPELVGGEWLFARKPKEA